MIIHFCYCRSIAGMRGFSRETIIKLATNIEFLEYLAANNKPPEHPRASTTDDVECFFSVLRDSVGKDFTLKEVNLSLTSLLVYKLVLYLYTGSIWLEKGCT